MRNHETAAELDNPSSSAKIAAYSGSVKVYFLQREQRVFENTYCGNRKRA